MKMIFVGENESLNHYNKSIDGATTKYYYSTSFLFYSLLLPFSLTKKWLLILLIPSTDWLV